MPDAAIVFLILVYVALLVCAAAWWANAARSPVDKCTVVVQKSSYDWKFEIGVLMHYCT